MKRKNIPTIYILPHTHWDSEWYEMKEAWNLELVHLLDGLLDIMERNPSFKYHFDGQVSPIADYLDILSEEDPAKAKKARSKIRTFVRRGQFSIGPLWTTAEESLCSLESLIRNLNKGIRFAKQLGGASSVYYNVDAFQHHSQQPQIITGCGLGGAFVWRGIKEEKDQSLKSTMFWKSPDGSAVLLVYPIRSYAHLWRIPEDPRSALDFLEGERSFLEQFAVNNNTLLMQGNDQLRPQENIHEIIDRINRLPDGSCRVMLCTPHEFIQEIAKKASGLNTISGELTQNWYAPILSGQVSARMYLKQMNHHAEIALERWAEPFAAFSWGLGEKYPTGFLEKIWDPLLRNHFHHCNACGADEVHREGEVRYTNVLRMSHRVIAQSLQNIANRIDTTYLQENEEALVLFNPSTQKRSEVIQAQIHLIETTLHPDALILKTLLEPEKLKAAFNNFVLLDGRGKEVPYQALKRGENTVEIAFAVKDVPALGYKIYTLRRHQKPLVPSSPHIGNARTKKLENNFVKVKIEDDGSLTVRHKKSGTLFKRLHIFEDSGDAGDTYNYAPPSKNTLVTTKGGRARCTLMHNGPFLATFRIVMKLRISQSLTKDRKARSGRFKNLILTSFVTLKKDSPRVDIKTRIDNKIKDHRLRVLFRVPKNDFVYVQTQGDVVRRELERPYVYKQNSLRDEISFIYTTEGKHSIPQERGPSPTKFQRGFVGMHDGKKGLAILNKGLPEYEAMQDGTIALTLLRSVGWLSRRDLSTRKGFAGPILEVPEAQCLREHVFEYAILPQSGKWDNIFAHLETEEHHLPLEAFQIYRQKGTLPREYSFLSLNSKELVLSALKKAYKGNDLIVRFFNPTNKNVRGKLKLHKGIKKAWRANMLEEKEKKLVVSSDKTLFLEVGAKEIITLRISPYK